MRAGRELDWVVLLAAAVLVAVGVAMIYSVFHPLAGIPPRTSFDAFQRQLLWVGVGVAALLVGFLVPFRYYESLAYLIYGLVLVALVLVLLLPGDQKVKRWIVLGGLRIQPSELAKVAVILVTARVTSGYRGDPNRWRTLLTIGMLVGVPALLILEEPDLGTAIVLVGIPLSMLYLRGFRGVRILFLLSPALASLLVFYSEQVAHSAWPFGVYIVIVFAVAYWRRAMLLESIGLVVANLAVGFLFPLFWEKLAPYQQRRILAFLNPGVDELGGGWQVLQSKIAIGSGGLLGKGFREGTQKALEFLPARHTDFVFSVIGEELGFFGALVVLLCFAVVVLRALGTAARAKSEFASSVAVGVAAYFFVQSFVNMGMTMGVASVTGIPLPLVSYGGSSMVVSCFLIGLLLNCRMRWMEY
jgi:rod shape determining protein RodA